MRRHLDWLMAGYARNIVPVLPQGKAPSLLQDNGTWHPMRRWQKLGRVFPALARAWDRMGASVGFRGAAGYLGIDVDVTIRSVSGAIRELLDHYLPDLPIRSVAHPEHVKYLALCRIAETPRSFNLSFRHGDDPKPQQVQLIGQGRQFVADGVHVDRLTPYVWDRHPCGLVLPRTSQEAFDAFWSALPAALTAAGCVLTNLGNPRRQSGKLPERCSSARLRALLGLIPNDRTWADYNRWMDMCHAIFGASNGGSEAQEMWIEWCAQVPQDLDYCAEKWNTIDADEVATGSHEIEWWARERNPAAVAMLDFADVEPDADILAAYENLDCQAHELFDNWCLVTGRPHTFYPMDNLEPHTFEGFNALMAPHERLLRKAFKMKNTTPARIFAANADNVVIQTMRWPGEAPIFKYQDHKVLNLWRPAPRPGRGQPFDPQVFKLYTDHALFVLGSQEAVDLWFKWHAFLLQHPSENVGWHWIIQSIQGLGKDLLLSPFVKAHTPKHATAVSSHQFLTDFNSYAEKRLIYVSELELPQNDKREGYTTLKEVTSANEFVHVNHKYGKEYDARNVASFVLFSNNERPMYLPDDDRRFYVIDCRDVKVKNQDYYANIAGVLNQHWAMIAEYTYALPLTKQDYAMLQSRAPVTESKLKLIDLNLPDWEHVLREITEDIAAGTSNYRPVATSMDIQNWLKAKNITLRRLDPEIMHKLGIRPLVPAKRNPKAPESFKGQRLWRLVDIWTDHKGVEYNLANLGPMDLYRLYVSGRVGPPSLSVVADEADVTSEPEE